MRCCSVVDESRPSFIPTVRQTHLPTAGQRLKRLFVVQLQPPGSPAPVRLEISGTAKWGHRFLSAVVPETGRNTRTPRKVPAQKSQATSSVLFWLLLLTWLKTTHIILFCSLRRQTTATKIAKKKKLATTTTTTTTTFVGGFIRYSRLLNLSCLFQSDEIHKQWRLWDRNKRV